MTTTMNSYDALYTNLKNQFTVVYNGKDCTVGDFMLMKSQQRSESALPIVTTTAKNTSLATIVDYVNDRLTVKKAPVKDKTIRNFPMRTSLSAMLSATAACALVISCGVFALNTSSQASTNTSLNTENTKAEYFVDTVTPEEVEETVEYDILNEAN